MSGQRKTLSLFVFIDAFGWRLLQEHSFLDDVLTSKRPLGTVFGYSSTCIPTILTGTMPRDHGHFSFFYYRPDRSPFGVCRWLKLVPSFLTRPGRVRRVMSRMLRRFYGYTGYFQIYSMPFRHLPLFDYSEKRDLYRPDGINGGQSTIFDFLEKQEIPFHVSDWRDSEESNIRALQRDLSTGEPEFAYLYTADMDALLHEHGTRSPLVGEKIRWYEEQLRETYALAFSRYDDVHLHVFSDHGQADVVEHCDLIPAIDALGLRFGVDFVAVYDSTMARFWFLTEGSREKIVSVLEKEARGRILGRDDLVELGCDFPGDKYGELFFLLDPGVLLCPSFLGEAPLAAMHGYDPEDVDSTAMIASNVSPDPVPTRLDDMFELMAREAMWSHQARAEPATTAGWTP